MFRPDLMRSRSIEQAITDLAKIGAELNPGEPRAIRIAAMIRDLRAFKVARALKPPGLRPLL